jgi:acyl carrier protein
MENKVLEIINGIREVKGLPVLESIGPEARLREDLSLNSFDLAELTVKIEDEFDIDIFENGLVSTIGEIFAILSE